MNLVLVESPTKARKLSQYLGKEYVVEASMGHVRDLPKSTLGVHIDNDFEPDYEISEGKKAQIAKLKKLAAASKIVYLATDPDREGEAIAWHLQYLLTQKKDISFVRSTFHEITKDAVMDAIEHPTSVRLDLVDAQQARRVVDRLVGYYLSPVLWKKVRRGLSAGRVQSVALRLIVEREKEILAFKPVEYWEVDAMLHAAAGDFTARVMELNGKTYAPVKAEEVQPVVEKLKLSAYTVKDVEKTERRRVSLPPFTTSTLQQAASNKLGWSAKQTMRAAQQLYEEGLITYHRTDSIALSQQSLTMVRSFIAKEYGPEYLPELARVFKNSSKNAQEAHEAIRPTDVHMQSPETDEKVQKLYQLIWSRFVACQMEAAVYDQTAVVVEAKYQDQTCVLRCAGSTMKFDGWMKLFPSQGETQLPLVAVNEALKLQDVLAAQKFTQPPARYNDASLVKTLEKLGIGRPSTYASIISVISDRGYVERQEKAFIPTAIGTTVSDFLVLNFPKEMEYQFTADMEDDLDAISRGEKKWKTVIRGFFEPFEKKVLSVTKDADRAKIPVEDTGEMCPDCKEGKLVIRSGRFGKFISCSRYPECKHTAKLVEKLGDMKCPECVEGDIVVKRTKRGRTFYGCSRYPACNYASWNKPGTPAGDREAARPKKEYVPKTLPVKKAGKVVKKVTKKSVVAKSVKKAAKK